MAVQGVRQKGGEWPSPETRAPALPVPRFLPPPKGSPSVGYLERENSQSLEVASCHDRRTSPGFRHMTHAA